MNDETTVDELHENEESLLSSMNRRSSSRSETCSSQYCLLILILNRLGRLKPVKNM